MLQPLVVLKKARLNWPEEANLSERHSLSNEVGEKPNAPGAMQTVMPTAISGQTATNFAAPATLVSEVPGTGAIALNRLHSLDQYHSCRQALRSARRGFSFRKSHHDNHPPHSTCLDNALRKLACAAFFAALLLWSGMAMAVVSSDITVVAPGASSRVSSPFNVYARSSTCEGQQVSGIGYSIDTSSNTQIVNATQINTLAIIGVGTHTVHIKSWGVSGSACDTDVTVIVYDGALLPPTITAASNLQRLGTWVGGNDTATNGFTTGSTSLTTGGFSGQPRQYTMSFLNGGGEIFHVAYDSDPAATNFIYDAEIELTSTVGLGNIEMDMNQVMANGQTVIYGVQCDGFYNTWDYTINSGTPKAPIDTWVHSNLPCNPQNWAPNTWHHVQIAYSRDAVGNVTYQSVTLDEVESDFIGATGNSAFALGWGSTLLTNFQLDGMGAEGKITAYLDNLTIYRW